MRGENFLTARSGISYSDYRVSMHLKERRRCRRVVPPWAYDTKAMRLIFETRAARVLKMGVELVGTREHLLRLWAGIVWHVYRRGLNSVEAAQELNITPWCLRQQLRRLNIVAREVCPELTAPARLYGGPIKRSIYLDQKILDLEWKLKRAQQRGRRGHIPRYQIQLEGLRNLKSERDGARQKATVFCRAA